MMWKAEETQNIQKGGLWRPLRLLYEKARTVRESYIREAQQATTVVDNPCLQPHPRHDMTFGQRRDLGAVGSTAASLGLDLGMFHMPQADVLGTVDEPILDPNGVSILATNPNDIIAELPAPYQNSETTDGLQPFFNNFPNDSLAAFNFNALPQVMADSQTSQTQVQTTRPDLTDEETINRWLSQGDISNHPQWTANFS